MENILVQYFSNNIFFPDKCLNCNCFTAITETHKAYKILNYKYHCLVKEGDTYCDFIQKDLDFVKGLDKIEGIEYLEERKKSRIEFLEKYKR